MFHFPHCQLAQELVLSWELGLPWGFVSQKMAQRFMF